MQYSSANTYYSVPLQVSIIKDFQSKLSKWSVGGEWVANPPPFSCGIHDWTARFVYRFPRVDRFGGRALANRAVTIPVWCVLGRSHVTGTLSQRFSTTLNNHVRNGMHTSIPPPPLFLGPKSVVLPCRVTSCVYGSCHYRK